MEKYINEIKNLTIKTDAITQYLLFTQTVTYMGMSLPTAAVIFWSGYFINKSGRKEDESNWDIYHSLTRLIPYK